MGADVWVLLRALHLLAMALFVGGQLVLAVAVVPALREDHREALRTTARRFAWAALAALLVLVATGVVMASWAGLWGSPLLHVKLTLVALALGLVAWHIRRPDIHLVEALLFFVSLAIVGLGVALAHAPVR